MGILISIYQTRLEWILSKTMHKNKWQLKEDEKEVTYTGRRKGKEKQDEEKRMGKNRRKKEVVAQESGSGTGKR